MPNCRFADQKAGVLREKITTEIATARSHGTKTSAWPCSSEAKKNHEKQLEHIDGVLNTIQHQKGSLENASMNSDVLQVISSSAKALKGAHNEMDVDQVHDLMEDIAEQQEVATEIANAISNPVGLQNDVDEDDLLRELEEMENEDMEAQMLDIGITPADEISKLPKMPATPMTDLPTSSKTAVASSSSKKKQEDDDLAELEAWANA
uniref:Charged multivesicular body protein 4b n=1 Tax=Ditylenchus dipsaci TaxID=166011 RepID=A0A915DJQ8_9BILA